MTGTEFLVALVIAVGLVGIVVPVLPGSALVLGAIIAWAVLEGTGPAWVIAGFAALIILAGWVTKYVVPGRRLQLHGVSTSTMLLATALGIVGFFVIPVVGLVIGFVLGVYLVEWWRTSAAEAWPRTVHALKAIGLGILVEAVFTITAVLVWVVGVVVT